MPDSKGKKPVSVRPPSKPKKQLQSIIQTRSAQAKSSSNTGVGNIEEEASEAHGANIGPMRLTGPRHTKRVQPDVKTEDDTTGEQHPRKRPKVDRTTMKAGSSSDHKAGPVRKAIASVSKVEPQVPTIQYQVSDDEVEVIDSFSMTPTHPRGHPSGVSKSRIAQALPRDPLSATIQTFGNPPKPPFGLEGRGSYVWVPYDDQDKKSDNASLEEQQADADFADNIAEEDDNGSAHTQEEYEDLYALNDDDIERFEESGFVDQEEEGTGQIAGPSSAVIGPSTVFLEDVESPKISKPTKCEIWALFNSADEYKNLMDPKLKHAYKSLPPLRSCTLTTWRSDNEDTGFIMWGSWKHQLQNRNMDYLLRFITFQRFDYFINPARADPTWFDTFSTDNYLYTIRTRRDHKICLCLSPVFVVKSRLLEAQSRSLSKSSGKGMMVKSLDCVFHSYEWERSLSFWCTVFGVETMQAQLNGSVISIETKPGNPDNTVDLESSAPGLFSSTASPSKKKAAASTRSVKIQLKHTDQIPIFDGRTHHFELNESLKSLNEQLPPFESEIPHGSLALVAYTANSYYRSQKTGQSSQHTHSNKNLALNINWVVVLGIPK